MKLGELINVMHRGHTVFLRVDGQSHHLKFDHPRAIPKRFDFLDVKLVEALQDEEDQAFYVIVYPPKGVH